MEQKINKKIILKIILYVIFLCFNGYLFFVGLTSSIPMILVWFVCLNDKIYQIIINNFDIFLFIPLCSPFASYLLAKMFGMFNYIDNLKVNLFKKIFLLMLISILSFLILFIRYRITEDIDFALKIASLIFALIPAFLLYKYFQFLTKKYPMPFEKIGYYCSIEFYKGLFKKILSEIKKKG